MPTSRLSRSLKEAIEWLLLGMFLGCALNMNATVTEYKSNKQGITTGPAFVATETPKKSYFDGCNWHTRVSNEVETVTLAYCPTTNPLKPISGDGWKCVDGVCTNGQRSISMSPGETKGRIPPPTEIVVDGERFSITVKADLGKNLLGTTVVATKQIEIKAGQSLAVEKDTVLHECIHAAFGSDFKDLTGKKWGEEQATYWLTPRLLKIITSNPKLLEYLTQP